MIVDRMEALAAVRVALGALCLTAPRTARRLSLLPTTRDAGADAMTRFYATRALAMGALYLLDHRSRPALAKVGRVVDVADTGFLAMMLAARRISPGSAIELMAITAGAAAVGLADRGQSRT